MNPVSDCTATSSFSFALPAADRITAIFQSAVPRWHSAQSLLSDYRFLLALSVVGVFTAIFYQMLFPTKPKAPIVNPFANESFASLLKQAVLELHCNKKVPLLLDQAMNEKFESNEQARTAFGGLLKDPELLALSIEHLSRLSQLPNVGNRVTKVFINELLWERMGDDTIISTNAHSLLYAYNVQQLIARQPLQNAIPDPQDDPFFWALACQRAPKDLNILEWQNKIPDLLKPQKELDSPFPPSEYYAEIVALLKLQNSGKSGWAKCRLDALQYLADLQKQTK